MEHAAHLADLRKQDEAVKRGQLKDTTAYAKVLLEKITVKLAAELKPPFSFLKTADGVLTLNWEEHPISHTLPPKHIAFIQVFPERTEQQEVVRVVLEGVRHLAPAGQHTTTLFYRNFPLEIQEKMVETKHLDNLYKELAKELSLYIP